MDTKLLVPSAMLDWGSSAVCTSRGEPHVGGKIRQIHPWISNAHTAPEFEGSNNNRPYSIIQLSN